MVLALAVVGVLAVQAGLIWAGTGRPEGSGAPPAVAATSPSHPSSPAGSSPAGSSPAGPARRSSAPHPSSSPARPARATPPAESSRSTSSPTSSPRVATTDDWLAVARELDRARAAALVGRDPAGLTAVYTSSAPARSADAATIARLSGQGWRVAGAAHRIVAVKVLAAGPTVRLELTDSLPSYRILDSSGMAVGRTAARTQNHRVLELVSTAAGYRIASVTGS